jgi:hypothetical protein
VHRSLGKARRFAVTAALTVGLLAAPGLVPRVAFADEPVTGEPVAEEPVAEERTAAQPLAQAVAQEPTDAPRVAESLPAPSGPSTTAKVIDAALLRPLGALSVLAGIGFFVASLPFTVAAEQVGTAREVLVETPYRDAFDHPLGAI